MEYDMDRACSTHVEDKKFICFSQNIRSEELIWKNWALKGVNWIHLAQVRDRWWAVMNR
jgi:hypothetical protein